MQFVKLRFQHQEKSDDCICKVIYRIFPSQIYLERSFCNEGNNPFRAILNVPRVEMTEFIRYGVRKMVGQILE